MGLTRKGRHLRPKPKKRGPVVVGTAAALWFSPGNAAAGEVHVRSGDTLSDLALRHGTSVAALARANGIKDVDRIYAGQRLRLPAGGASGAGGGTYVVRAGETLSSIAARHGTTVSALASQNNLPNPNLIVIGQKLTVGGSVAPLEATQVVEVAAGETLSEIAGRHGTSVEALARANGISDPNLVVAGQKLVVTGGSGGSTAMSVEAMLEQEAIAQGVDPALVKAVAWQESGWNQGARSSAGAIGVMQVMPGTADYVNQVLGTGDLKVRKAPDNIRLGVTYLRHVIGAMGSEEKGLAAYYSGPGNVGRRLKGYQRTYVNAVLAHRTRF